MSDPRLRARDGGAPDAVAPPELGEPTEGETLPPGTEIGPFVVVERLGSGGMADVYLAERRTREFRQRVALKVARSGRRSEERRRRFAQERRIAAGLDHPHIARLVDGGETAEGHPWFAMELVAGQPIDRYCAERRLPLAERLRLVATAARAVDHAHRNQLVHRDLKPSNLFVTHDGHVKLLDFGIAKALAPDPSGEHSLVRTASSLRLLTPRYASPEQLSGLAVGPESDQFQLGLLLFELTTGCRYSLVGGGDPGDATRRIVRLEAPPPSEILGPAGWREGELEQVASERGTTPRALRRAVAGDLDAIVTTALARKPQDRYASAAELADDLERFLAGEPVAARGDGLAYRATSLVRRRPATAALAGLLVVLCLALVAWAAVIERRADERQRLAQRFEREAEEIEELIRLSYRLPLHDTRREQRIAAARLDQLAVEMREIGPLATAAGSYALGRGLLALQQPAAALPHLEEAWRHGHRGAGIHYALGRTLGLLYQRALVESEGLSDAQARASRRHELEDTLRQPALEHLRAAVGLVTETPQLVEGHVAYYETRFGDALARARVAQEQAPWAYEALVLEGAVFHALGLRHVAVGEVEAAYEAYDAAARALGRAQEIAASDPTVRESMCLLLQSTILLERSRGGAVEELFADAVAACEAAIVADPDRTSAYVAAADIQWRLAEVATARGEDAGSALDEMARLALEATRRDPDHAPAHHRMGMSAFLRAEAARAEGRDPRAAYTESIAALHRALGLMPTFAFAHNALSLASSHLAAEEMARGELPTERLTDAVDHARRAARLLPDWLLSRANLAHAHLLEARLALLQGARPEPFLGAALDGVGEALRRNPRHGPGLGMTARLELYRARLAIARGDDPAAALDAAGDAVRRQLAIDPADPMALLQQGTLHLLRATAALAAAAPDLERADAELAAIPRDLPLLVVSRSGTTESRDLQIAAALAAVRRAALAGEHDVEARLAAAATIVASLVAGRGDAELLAATAELERRTAAWRLLRGEDPRPAIAAGRQAGEAALRRNPRGGAAGIELAALELAAAVDAAGAARAEAVAAAEARLAEAVATNPFRQRETEPYRRLAAALAAGAIERSEAALGLLGVAAGDRQL